MVSFDSREPGTDPAAWEGALAALPALELGAVRRLVVATAHPDDETLGAGGLIALLAGRGTEVEVVVATRGEGSHPASPTTDAAELARIRGDELRAAIARLAPNATLRVLDLPDGRVTAHEDAVRSAIADALTGADLLVSTWRDDGHPDHAAVGRAAAAAAEAAGVRHLEAPIWLWHWGEPAAPPDGLVRLSLTPAARAARAAALAEHRTQVAPLSPAPGDEAIVGPTLAAVVARPDEVLLETAGRRAADAAYFDGLYAEDDDPWAFTTRWYEERKRRILLASLPRRRFGAAFEVGCSIGVLTAALAARTDHLLAVDVAERALEIARSRVPDPHVEFARLTLPEEWPNGRYDLVVVSEVAYYLTPAESAELWRRAADALTDDGVLVACHWRHPTGDAAQRGDEVHAQLDATGLATQVRHVEEDFVLEVRTRQGAPSVARAEGLA